MLGHPLGLERIDAIGVVGATRIDLERQQAQLDGLVREKVHQRVDQRRRLLHQHLELGASVGLVGGTHGIAQTALDADLALLERRLLVLHQQLARLERHVDRLLGREVGEVMQLGRKLLHRV